MIKFLLDCIGSFLMWLFILILLACASLSYLQKHPACDHTWYYSSKTKLACWQSEVTYKCISCEKTKTEQINDDNHDYIITVLKEATCTDVGMQHMACRTCGYDKDMGISLKKHTCLYKVTKEVGMFTAGEEIGTCSVCGEKATRSIAAYGTSEDEPYITSASNFYREAPQEGGKEKFSYEWVQLSGVIKAIERNGKYGTAYYLVNENNKKLICYFLRKPNDSYSVGDNVKITGNVQAIDKNTIELVFCMFSNSITEGDSGDEVTKMKKRLQELGYFTAGASLSNTYNSITTERIKLFQEANGLHPTGDANEATLKLLYSSQAINNPNAL